MKLHITIVFYVTDGSNWFRALFEGTYRSSCRYVTGDWIYLLNLRHPSIDEQPYVKVARVVHERDYDHTQQSQEEEEAIRGRIAERTHPRFYVLWERKVNVEFFDEFVQRLINQLFPSLEKVGYREGERGKASGVINWEGFFPVPPPTIS